MDATIQLTVAGSWPEGVIARYLTVGGATVDIVLDDDVPSDPVMRSACGGCGEREASYSSPYGRREPDARQRSALQSARQWSQVHAGCCRAMPKPEGA